MKKLVITSFIGLVFICIGLGWIVISQSKYIDKLKVKPIQYNYCIEHEGSVNVVQLSFTHKDTITAKDDWYYSYSYNGNDCWFTRLSYLKGYSANLWADKDENCKMKEYVLNKCKEFKTIY